MRARILRLLAGALALAAAAAQDPTATESTTPSVTPPPSVTPSASLSIGASPSVSATSSVSATPTITPSLTFVHRGRPLLSEPQSAISAAFAVFSIATCCLVASVGYRRLQSPYGAAVPKSAAWRLNLGATSSSASVPAPRAGGLPPSSASSGGASPLSSGGAGGGGAAAGVDLSPPGARAARGAAGAGAGGTRAVVARNPLHEISAAAGNVPDF